MREFAYKIGLRLAQIKVVRNAIDQRADLSAFKKRPTFRILFGVFLIGISFTVWPVISALGVVAIYLRIPPLLALAGGTTLYLLSHLCYLAGMALSGAEYSWIFLRWLMRLGVEKLLKCAPTRAPADCQSPLPASRQKS